MTDPTAREPHFAVTESYDVVVVGGGPAGVPAAIQAARAGARTLLAEKNGALGGTTTVAGVSLPGLFHAWGKQVIAGIGWDLVSRSVSLSGGSLPDFRDWRRPFWLLQVRVNPAIYAAVLDEGVLEAGATLAFHTMIGDIRSETDGWQLVLCRKEGLTTCKAARVVDCTGDANVVTLAGYPVVQNEERQPGTIMIRLAGYDIDDIDLPALEAAYQEALATGRVFPGDISMSENPVRAFLRARGENVIHVPGVDAATSGGRSAAEVAARRTVLRLFTFLRTQPGLEDLSIESWAPECGIRESVTIDGLTRITVDDYTSGRIWEDAVCNSFYPIDIHRPDGDGVEVRPLPIGTVATIPRAAMIPRGSERLMVAGRAVAGDQAANSAYRVQASCMAMGQAAGAIAALSAKNQVPLQDVPIEDVHALLSRHGALVPGTSLPQPQAAQAPHLRVRS